MAATSTIETEHPGELQRGLALLAVFDECDQRDGIAALVAAREVGPAPVRKLILKEPRWRSPRRGLSARYS